MIIIYEDSDFLALTPRIPWLSDDSLGVNERTGLHVATS